MSSNDIGRRATFSDPPYTLPEAAGEDIALCGAGDSIFFAP